MKFVLLVFMFGFQGDYSGHSVYDTMEACEEERASVAGKLADWNSKGENAGKRILTYSATCSAVKEAPAGKGV